MTRKSTVLVEGYSQFDGVDDRYHIVGSFVYPLLIGARALIGRTKFTLNYIPAATTSIFAVQTNAGSAGFVLNVTSAGAYQIAARSREAGTSGIAVHSWGVSVELRKWVDVIWAVDYTTKELKVWINGRFSGYINAVGWEDNTFQIPYVSQNVVFGLASVLWNGRVADSYLATHSRLPTDNECLQWFITDQRPANIVTIFDIDYSKNIAPVDLSINAMPIVITGGFTTPYGLHSGCAMARLGV